MKLKQFANFILLLIITYLSLKNIKTLIQKHFYDMIRNISLILEGFIFWYLTYRYFKRTDLIFNLQVNPKLILIRSALNRIKLGIFIKKKNLKRKKEDFEIYLFYGSCEEKNIFKQQNKLPKFLHKY